MQQNAFDVPALRSNMRSFKPRKLESQHDSRRDRPLEHLLRFRDELVEIDGFRRLDFRLTRGDQLPYKAIHPIYGTMKFEEVVLRFRMPHRVRASDHDGQQRQAVVGG